MVERFADWACSPNNNVLHAPKSSRFDFRFAAFSLAEMMVVLLILSIILAASMPIITKRTQTSAAESSSEIWQYIGSGPNIYFGAEEIPGVAIGTSTMGDSLDKTRLLINTSSASQSHITFQQSGSETGRLKINTSGVALGNNVFNDFASGSNNVAIGYDALSGNTTGYGNVSIGQESLKVNQEGSENIAIGYRNLMANISGSNNVAVGSFGALYGNITGSNNTAIGYGACYSVQGDNKTCIGVNSGPSSGSTWASSSDTTQRTFIGGSPVVTNGGQSVLEIHNTTTGSELSWSKLTSNNAPTVIINGNLIVRGRTYMALGEDEKTRALFGDSGFVKATYSYPAPDGWNITFTSDSRLKNIKGSSKAGLEQINKLRTYKFKFKKDKKQTPHVGVIAQDLEKIFPDSVSKDKKGFLRIRLEDMFYAMINAVQELDKNVQEIFAKIQILDDKVIALIRVDQLNSKRIKELELRVTMSKLV